MSRPLRPPIGAVALPRWQRWSVYSAVALVSATGIAWLLVSPGDDADSAASGGLRNAATWLLRGHGVAAYVLLVAVGSVLPLHLRLGWALGRNRWSGAVLVGVFLALAATGLWLYYGPPTGREAVSATHWIIGVALPAWLLLHRTRGRRSRRTAADVTDGDRPNRAASAGAITPPLRPD